MFLMNFQGGLPGDYQFCRIMMSHGKFIFSVELGKIFLEKWLNLECFGVKLFTKIKNYDINCHPGGHVAIT